MLFFVFFVFLTDEASKQVSEQLEVAKQKTLRSLVFEITLGGGGGNCLFEVAPGGEPVLLFFASPGSGPSPGQGTGWLGHSLVSKLRVRNVLLRLDAARAP